MKEDSITGCSIIEAEDLAAAEEIAQENPYVSSIRVYEIREHDARGLADSYLRGHVRRHGRCRVAGRYGKSLNPADKG